jgi:hypothetical protein
MMKRLSQKIVTMLGCSLFQAGIMLGVHRRAHLPVSWFEIAAVAILSLVAGGFLL